MQTLHVSFHLDDAAPTGVTLHLSGGGDCDVAIALPAQPAMRAAVPSPPARNDDDYALDDCMPDDCALDDYTLGGYAGI